MTFQSALFSTENMERYLVAGLGNPDRKYVNTRHNVGFEMIDTLAACCSVKVNKAKCRAAIAECKIGGVPVILAKPLTYMNLSGESLRDLCAYFKIPAENIVVMYDDMSLEVGKIRIRQKGSAGGHNGMKNIIYHLKTDEIARVRFGIGKPLGDPADYVLSKFPPSDIKLLTEAAKSVPDIVELIVSGKVSEAMNKYN